MKNTLVKILFLALLCISYNPSSAQTVTVGGTTNTSITPKNYSTIQAAYNACNVAGDSWIQINSNYNPASESFPVNFTKLSNKGTNDRIIIYLGSSTAVSISKATTIFNFNGCSNVEIDGNTTFDSAPLWTIQNTSLSTVANTIQFINGATNNIVRGFNIYGSNPGSGYTSGVVLFGGSSGTTGNSNNQMYYNTIGGLSVTNMPYQVISSAGTTGKPNETNSFTNNNIINFSNKGIFIDSVYANANNWSVQLNSFYQTANYTVGTNIIVMDIGSGDGGSFSSNYIGGQAPNCGGNPFVIPSSSSSSFVGLIFRSNCINNNYYWNGGATINNISLTTTLPSGMPFIGIETRGPAIHSIGSYENIGTNCTITNNSTGNTNGFEAVRIASSNSLLIRISVGGFVLNGAKTNTQASLVRIKSGTDVSANITFNPVTVPSAGDLTLMLVENPGSLNLGGSMGNGLTYNSTGTFTAIKNTACPAVTIKNFSIRTINLGLSSNTAENILIDNQAGSLNITNCSFNALTYGKNAAFTLIKNTGTSTTLFNNTFSAISHTGTGITSAVTFVNSTGNASIRNCTFGNTTATNLSFSGNAPHVLLKTTGTSTDFSTNKIQNVSCPNGGSATSFCLFNHGAGTVTAKYNSINSISINTTNPTELALFQSSASSATFDGNVISDINYTNTGNTSLALKIFSLQGVSATGSVSQNLIRWVSNASTSASSKIVGIEVVNGSYNLFNNAILLDNKNATNALSISGILLLNTSGSNTIYHNTIKVSGTQTGNAASFAVSRTGTGPANVRNNVFQNIRTGGTLGHYTESTIATGYTTDYNYLQSSNANQLCMFGGADKNLASWKTSTAASNSVTGTITLDATGRLPFGANLSGFNLIATVPSDLTGGLRSNPPSLGAYESETLLSIATMSPLKGAVGSTVTLTGSGFLPIDGTATVRFGTTKATIVSSTDNILTVTVPAGATYGPISVVVNALTAQTKQSFLVANTSNCSYFELPKTVVPDQKSLEILPIDINNDGATDIIHTSGNTNYIYKNDGNGNLSLQNSYGNGGGGTETFSVGDLNRDGNLDYTTRNNLNINNGTGTFTSISQNEIVYSIQTLLIDLNKDGISDKVFINSNAGICYAFGNQTDFGITTIIEPISSIREGSMAVEDVNGDGNYDVIYCTGTKYISVALGTSSGDFNAPIQYATGSFYIDYLKAADLDNDGDVDFVVCKNSYQGDTKWGILLNKNVQSGTFPAYTEYSSASNITAVLPADINGDGNIDVITANYVNASISLFTGNGTGAYSTKEDYPVGNNPTNLYLADMNNDGKQDIIAICIFSSSSVNKNEINVLLSTCTRPRPILNSISATNGIATSSIILNGKYFDPIVSNNTVYFGTIKAIVTAATSTQLTVTVPSGITLEMVSVVVAGKQAENALLYNLAATSTTCVAKTAFDKQFDISTNKGVSTIIMEDINNDGKKDILSLNIASAKIGIYINTSPINGDKILFAAPTYLNTGASPATMICADMNNDGYTDILCSNSTNKISIYKNTGTGSFAANMDIGISGNNPITILSAGDVNADGYTDIVCAASNRLYYIRNTQGAITASNFTEDYNYNFNYTDINSIEIIDLDNDFLAEVVVSINAYQNDHLSIFKNFNTHGGLLKFYNDIQIPVTNVNACFLKDIDSDNKADLIFYSSGNTLQYMLNTSTASGITFGGATNASGSVSGTTLTMGDMDGDGKTDIVSLSSSTLTLLKNNFSGTTSGFTASGTFTSPTGYTFKDVVLSDVNIDGKPDIVASAAHATNADSILVYKNWIKPTAVFTGTTTVDTICSGSTSTKLQVALTGVSPWSITYNATVGTTTVQSTINNIQSSPYTFTQSPTNSNYTTQTTTYTLVSVGNTFGCSVESATGSAKIVTVGIPPAPTITSAAASLARCGIGTIPITGAVYTTGTTSLSNATINWYPDNTSSTKSATGFTYTTPSIGTTTTFYAASEYYKCPSATRTPATAVINAQPNIISTIPGNRCDPGTLDVTLITDIGTTSWFDASTGGNFLTTGNTYTTPSLIASKTYYASVDYNGCKTPATGRIAVQANINTTPVLSNITSASRCDAGTIFLTAATNAGTLNWYTDAAASTAPFAIGSTYGNQNLTATTTYYLQANNNGCLSAIAPITATIINTPTLITPVNAARCDSGTVALSATTNGTILKWYDASSGGNLVNTGLSYTTPKLKTNTTYYLEASNGTCVMPSRTAINATVTIPAINETVLTAGKLNIAYSQTLTATNLTSPAWSISGALPAGMTFSAGGVLSGTPTATGTFPITISATKSGCTASRAYTFEIVPNTTTWNGTAWSNGIPDATTDAVIASAYTSGLNEVLNARSLTVNAGVSFTLNGTSTVTIGNTLTNNGQISQKCSSTLTAATKLGNAIQLITPPILPAVLSAGKQGAPYAQPLAFAATNPVFSISSGSLPPGLALNGNVIQGIPTVSGSFTLKIKAVSGTCIAETADLTLAIKDLIDPELAFIDRVVIKHWEDAAFTLPVTTKNTGSVIHYSIVTPNACAEILPVTNQIRINCASPSTDVWIKITQDATTDYEAAVDSIRMIILKAQTTLNIHSTAAFVEAQNGVITFDTTNYDGPVTFGASANPSVALVLPDGTIQPKSAGTFSFKVTLPPTALYSGLDTTFSFTVYPAPVPPVAVADTIFLIRDLDLVIHSGSINVLSNDIAVTGILKINLTDLDLSNSGKQHTYYAPPIGAFEFDTLTGILSIIPFKALKGTSKIGYTITDANGLTSAVTYVYIIVLETQATPDLKANETMTPNGDGQNDALIVGYTDINAPNSIVIFDEASNIVFQKDNYMNDWMGTDTKGDPLEPGVYFYAFKEKSGTERILRGYVQIVR